MGWTELHMCQFADPEKPEVIGCTDAEEVIQNGFAQQAQSYELALKVTSKLRVISVQKIRASYEKLRGRGSKLRVVG